MTQHAHGWNEITPTFHKASTQSRLLLASQSFYDEADRITEVALKRGWFFDAEHVEIATLHEQAEILEGIAKGTIEFVICPNNPKSEGVNGEFIKTVNDYYDACVIREWIKERD